MGKRYCTGRLESLLQTDFESSAYLNDKTFIDIYNRMKEICLNLYVYENLPDTVDVRYMELMLCTYGYCFFFRDDISMDYLSLAGTLDWGFDVYGNYTNFTALSAQGGYRYPLTNDTGVILYNNFTRVPTYEQIKLFAWRAWNALRTADTNMSQQKTSKILKIPENRRLSWKNLLMKVQGNQIYAMVSDDMDAESASIDLSVPYIADKAMVAYDKVWNDFYTFIGVVNHSSDKKEREVQIEVMGHMGATEIGRNTMLRSRKIGFDKVNRMFGLNIEVKFNSQLSGFLLENRIETGWNDVNVHNYGEKDSRELQRTESVDK